MASRLASTVFQGSAKDAMVVEDAYKVSTAETRNSLFDSAKGIYGDAVSGLYANKGSIRELAAVVLAAKAGTISKADMLERSLSALGSSLPSLLGQLGGTLKNTIAGFLPDGVGDTMGVVYNNAQLILSVANISNAQDSAEFLAELTGNSDLLKVVNIGAESAIFGGILKELMSFGIPELMDDVIDQIQNETVKANALAYLSTSAVNGSDLVMTNKIIDVIGLTAFLEQNPDAINRTLSSFFFGTLDTVDTYPAKRIELLALLTRIDAHWSESLRNGAYIKNLEPFTVCSPDAKTLMLMAAPERTLTLAAAKYPRNNINSIIKGLYPDAYIP